MKTRDIDYTGCHPQIAAALKEGKMIECWVWDNLEERNKEKRWVIGYSKIGGRYMQIGNVTRRFAEPVKEKSWFPGKNEPVLCWDTGSVRPSIGDFTSKEKNGRYWIDNRYENIRRVIYPNDTDTVKALKLVSIPIKDWPEAPEGDENP